MANVAAIFSWSPQVMGEMELPELLVWHAKAIDRHKAMNGIKD
jgi:hypothetical protein